MPAATPATMRMRRSREPTLRRRPTRRAERAADLHGRPLAPARAAAAEREDRGERLDPDDAPADHAALVVERVNHRVPSPAPGLGREQTDQAGEEGARRRQEQHDERTYGERTGFADDLFAVRAERRIASNAFEQERLRMLEAREEPGADQPGHESDQRRVEERSSEDAEIERRRDGAQHRRERRRPARALGCPAIASAGLWLWGESWRAHVPERKNRHRLRVAAARAAAWSALHVRHFAILSVDRRRSNATLRFRPCCFA